MNITAYHRAQVVAVCVKHWDIGKFSTLTQLALQILYTYVRTYIPMYVIDSKPKVSIHCALSALVVGLYEA